MLLQALNGALQQVYTLRLGTQQREGVPGPINQTQPHGSREGNGFGESRRSGQSVGHMDGWGMEIGRNKVIQYRSVVLTLTYKYAEFFSLRL